MVRKVLLTVALVAGLTGCSSSAANVLNPFASPAVELGNADNRALLGEMDQSHSQNARHALEVMGSYRRTQEPQPAYPVVQPAEVRLMWVPDHLSKSGDLVPAHYYYLKVLNDRWAVQDAFDLEQQLNEGSKSGSATPWVYGDVGNKK